MKLLIVEDNAEMRRLIVKIVRRSRSDAIFECEDGAEALPAYRVHHPDWVLMDVQMRVLDGISATRQIINYFPDAKIAIVTDYGSVDLQQAARDAGAREYIVKEYLIDVRRIFGEQ